MISRHLNRALSPPPGNWYGAYNGIEKYVRLVLNFDVFCSADITAIHLSFTTYGICLPCLL